MKIKYLLWTAMTALLCLSCTPKEDSTTETTENAGKTALEQTIPEIGESFLLAVLEEDGEERLLHISYDAYEEAYRLFHSPMIGPGENPDWMPLPPEIMVYEEGYFKAALPAFLGGATELYQIKHENDRWSGFLNRDDRQWTLDLRVVELEGLIAGLNAQLPEESSAVETAAPSEEDQQAMELEAELDQPSLEESLAAFLALEEQREVEDQFQRLTWGTFKDAMYGPGGIHLIFEKDGQEELMLVSAEYSPLETVPFLLDTSANPELLDKPYMLQYKGYYLEEDPWNDQEVKVLMGYVEFQEDFFASAGYSDTFETYRFIEEFIEVLRDENWEMIEQLFVYPLEIEDSPIGPLVLENTEDFLQYRSLLFTKATMEALVNQQYSEISVGSPGFALGNGSIWFTPGEEFPRINMFFPIWD